ncbi:MAG TPA: GNAT family N-acetyltransferase [Pirellulales bacterium]|nr:GNAT family N-acetyltransferase [Pirellulales bacterium]
MAAPRLVRFTSVASLRAGADQWDHLWQRSEGVLPNGSAELIAQWLEQFSPQANFTALAVQHDGQLVAALPLVQRRPARLVAVGSLPCNTWCWAGDLLLDLTSDVSTALAVLAAEIARLPWPLLRIDAAPLESRRWQHFLAALDAAGLDHVQAERFRIGTVEIAEQLNRNWDAYEAAWSGNHRRHLRKAWRRADEAGGVTLDLRRPQSAQEVEALLNEGFQVEHSSWKGRSGSSVLSNPDMRKFYLRQATQLAHAGNLELAFLRHQGQAIAFEYGWASQGVYYTPKVGFDHNYAQFSPGQLLRYLLLQDAFSRADRLAVDFLGPLCDATARWATNTYPISRLLIGTGHPVGKALLASYRHVVQPVRKMLRGKRAAPPLGIVEIESRPAPVDRPLPAVTGKA